MTILDPDAYNAALEALREPVSLRQILSAVELGVSSLGFERFALVDQVSHQGVRAVYHNAPPAWATRQEDLARIERDPAVGKALSSPVPFAWNEEFYRAHDAEDLWREQAEHGYSNGICSSYGAADVRACIVVAAKPGSLPTSRAELYQRFGDMLLLAGACHQALTRCMPLVNLTPRERECLYWATQAKTSWETAKILGISERTVNGHLQRAMNELGVSKKEVAAALADKLGMLPLRGAA